MATELIDLAVITTQATYARNVLMPSEVLAPLVRLARAARALRSCAYEDIVPAAQEMDAALSAFTDSADTT